MQGGCFKRWLGVLIVVAACSTNTGDAVNRTDEIKIRGSDSEVNLVQRLGEAFFEQRGVGVAVTGGGSGVGIASLIDGTIDVANSSRPLLPEEELLALRKGVEPVPTLFATDALTVVVHKRNPIASLTLEEVAALFAGNVVSWEAFGGEGHVVLYGRQSSSGTYMFFRDAIVGGDFSRGIREMNGSAQIAEAVGRDPRGIGYLAVGYLKAAADSVRVVPIRAYGSSEAVDPRDRTAVRAGRYPIVRPLYQYTNGLPEGATLEFLRFELSPSGERLIEEMGFYPPIDAWREDNRHLLDRGG